MCTFLVGHHLAGISLADVPLVGNVMVSNTLIISSQISPSRILDLIALVIAEVLEGFSSCLYAWSGLSV
jgi:hypothetical protein